MGILCNSGHSLELHVLHELQVLCLKNPFIECWEFRQILLDPVRAQLILSGARSMGNVGMEILGNLGHTEPRIVPKKNKPFIERWRVPGQV